MPGKMHVDEVDTDPSFVRRLLAQQFPHWAELPLAPVESAGTDNALYRLGIDMVVRLPRRARTVETLKKERLWLPKLAPLLPLAVPTPLAEGEPAETYPWTWSVYKWIDGENATVDQIGDADRLARDLAALMSALQRIETDGAPPPGDHNFFRGAPLATRDGATRRAIGSLREIVDTARVAAVWDAALRAPVWSGAPVWIHGDLDSRNLLAKGGRLSAVIDWGSLGVGDPACDVMVVWKMLPAESRDSFRTALAIDEATWARGRGWAVSQALMALSYYTPETNPVLVGEARSWIDEVLADWGQASA